MVSDGGRVQKTDGKLTSQHQNQSFSGMPCGFRSVCSGRTSSTETDPRQRSYHRQGQYYSFRTCAVGDAKWRRPAARNEFRSAIGNERFSLRPKWMREEFAVSNSGRGKRLVRGGVETESCQGLLVFSCGRCSEAFSPNRRKESCSISLNVLI